LIDVWRQIDPYHLRNGDWTISKAINVPLPYGLWHSGKYHGHFATLEAAKTEFERLR